MGYGGGEGGSMENRGGMKLPNVLHSNNGYTD